MKIDIDALSNYIRQIDGNNRMGAGVLAEKIAEYLNQSPAIEPAQAVEPLDAPHPDYAEYITFEGSTRIVISPDDYEQLYNAATRRAPPAIDAETRHRLILVCEYLETVGLMFVSPIVISSQIRAILEAGNEN